MTKRMVRAESVEIGQWVIVGDRPAYCVEEISSNRLGDIILRCSFSGPGAYPCASLLLDPGETVTIEKEAREGVADPWGEGVEGFELPDARAYDQGAEVGHAHLAAQEIAEAAPRARVTFDETAHVFEVCSPAGEWCGAFDTYAEATRAAEVVADPWGEGVEGFDLPEAR